MQPDTIGPELPYILLRASQALFGKAPDALDDTQRNQALEQARREQQLENRVLRAPEAAAVMVPDEQLDRALAEIRERYDSQDGFAEDLARNGLDSDGLRLALYRQCKVDSVLEKIAADAPTASEVDISIFYHAHLPRFQVGETREAFHILVTIDDTAGMLAENARPAALARIQAIALQLAKKPHRFAELAQRHSECPTALQGGRVGPVTRGQLYQALDEVLFELKENEIGGPVESPMGFHLVRCGAIRRAQTVSLRDATPGIRRHLNQRFKESRQKQWLASLPDPQPETAP
ncbi:nitrogen fixation protein NifM [Methylogaea oryzae]|uniref:peptidylprolyl isomerase n=1 Tax=Methylogaea oryzae TaxID=1295382 RepID=A0A8D4VQ99_9GAMM|nr:nitrogen fixation protein NifM [Methylogaea oryzae]BBL72078.1 hypothetical protein MoryE10_26840 [Methylogaea oryzae]